MDLYNRIDELCKSKGLSIYKVCKLAGISFSVIYDLKSGKKADLNRKTAEKIATVLEISVDELYGEKQKTPDAVAPREEKYNEIFNLLSALPEEKFAEAVRYLKYLAEN